MKKIISMVLVCLISVCSCNTSTVDTQTDIPGATVFESITSAPEKDDVLAKITTVETTISETEEPIVTTYGEITDPDIRGLKWGMSLKQVEFYEGNDYTIEDGAWDDGSAYKFLKFVNKEFEGNKAELTLCLLDGKGLNSVSYTIEREYGYLWNYAFEKYGEPIENYSNDYMKGGQWNSESEKYVVIVLDFAPLEGMDTTYPQISFGPISDDLIIPTEDVNFDQPAVTAKETTTAHAVISNNPTIREKNALDSALSYLSFMAFSYSGLVEQLEFEGYTHSEAVYGADHCGADWNEQAAKSAKQYLEFSSFSRDGLIDQLEFEGFTHSQAVYGVDANFSGGSGSGNPDPNAPTMGEKNALNSALSYLSFMAFSYSGLVEQLEFEGYTHSEAVYGADHCGADWNEQAVKSAKQYLEFSSFSRSELIDQLEFEGFTHSQAVYAADANGY